MDYIAGYIGRKASSATNHISNLFAFTCRIFVLIFEQVYFTCVQALPIIIPIALVFGSMLIIQFTKVSGQYDLGKTMVMLIVRELGPVITALLVILRSATAVAIEISHMNIFHEIDAIEMAGIDPMRIVCLPRLIGITSAILCLFIVFDLVAIIGGYLIVWIFTYIPMGDFITQIGKAITATDIAVGIIKAIFFGIAITVTCLKHGFSVKRLITDIPVGTSKAAVECFFYCLVINVIISILFYM
ncbi:MAG: ABC transporter permease [Deltaproteobacteria bacterium]|nr:ABC transporter permease [Deltaproteobacteria bacterium]